ncbi:MAG: polysaccharide pyruvyl transferase family protein [bacterium]|nr:polysaccharide pyruvyl transferase family protein [bacterium]
MNIINFFLKTNLEKSFIIGYYGGLNFGDELLLEVILNLLKNNGVKDISFYYTSPEIYSHYHHDFGYKKIPATPLDMLKEVFKCKNIIIGGGGLWGLDFNKNIALLSLILFFAKYFLRKKIYLIGVGYYLSTTKLGRFAGWLAGFSSDIIIARDNETFRNFSRVSRNIFIDNDIVFNFHELDEKLYTSDVDELKKEVDISEKTIFITTRRFSGDKYASFKEEIQKFIEKNTDKKIIMALFEAKIVDKEGYNFFLDVSKKYKNITVVDFHYNPVALLFLFSYHHKNIAMISPQFHGQLVAHLTGASFLPISYDNKNSELFKSIGIKYFFDIKNVSYFDMQNFINHFYE